MLLDTEFLEWLFDSDQESLKIFGVLCHRLGMEGHSFIFLLYALATRNGFPYLSAKNVRAS